MVEVTSGLGQLIHYRAIVVFRPSSAAATTERLLLIQA